MKDCVFCGIVEGKIPGTIVHRDDDVVAFRDLNPQAPVHVLLVPRKHIPSLNEAEPADAELMGKVLLVARDIAAAEGLAEDGYRIVTNCGAGAGQTVFHVHFHLLGGRPMGWPPG